MDSTVIVAGLGLLTTLAAALITSFMQQRGRRESRVFEARVASYADLVGALYAYERATYSRVKARLEGRGDEDRQALRQEAWSQNAKARASIGVVALLTGSADLPKHFDEVRRKIGDLNQVITVAELREKHESIYDDLGKLITRAKADIK